MKNLFFKLLLLALFALVVTNSVMAQCGQYPCAPCTIEGTVTTNSNNCGITNSATVTLTSGNAPFTYVIRPAGQNPYPAVVTNSPTYTFTNLSPGTYYVWALDASGCIFTGACENLGPLYISDITVWSDCGSNGICVTAYGGTGTLTYGWNGPNGYVPNPGSCLNDIPAGIYTVTITDENGCTATASGTVTEKPVPQIIMTTTTKSTCNQANGSAFVMAQGGTGALSYLWSNGVQGQNLTGVVGGPNSNYTVLVTDVNGCTDSEQVHVDNFGTPVTIHLYQTTCNPANVGVTTQHFAQWSAPHCDSAVVTHVTLLPSSATTLNASICQGESYQFGGQNLTVAGTYRDTLVAANTCDSIVTLNLSVLPNSTSSFSASICQGSAYNFNGQNLTASGTYNAVLQSANGCDSTVTLSLQVLPNLSSSFSQTICAGDSFWYFGFRTQSGSYPHTYQTVEGCDSTVTLQLAVLPPADTVEIHETTCNPALAGVFPTVVQNSIFCDSIVTIKTVTYDPLGTDFATVATCNPDSSGVWWVEHLSTPDGCPFIRVTTALYKAPLQVLVTKQSCNPADTGTVSVTIPNMLGCDSLITTTVTTLANFIQTQTQATICAGESMTFGGQLCVSAGIYRDTLQSFHNCDSITTLFLTVLTPPQGSEAKSVCYGESYQWNGESYSSTGNYFHVFEEGAVNGCDSLATLFLTVLPVNDTMQVTTITCVLSEDGQISTTTMPDFNGCDSTTVTTKVWQPAFWNTIAVDTCIQSLNGVVFTDTVEQGGCNGIRTRIFSYSSNYESFTTWSCDGPVGDTTYQTTTAGCVTETTIHRLRYAEAVGYESQQICSSEFPFTWNGLSILEEGNYTATFANASWHGCDSTANLTVFELLEVQTSDTIWVCPGGFWVNPDGDDLFAGESWETNGPGTNSCDSTSTVFVEEFNYTSNFGVPGDVVLQMPSDTSFSVISWIESLANGSETFFNIPAGAAFTGDSLQQINDTIWVQNFYFSTPCESLELSREIKIQFPKKPVIECEVEIFPSEDQVTVVIRPLNGGNVERVDFILWASSQANRLNLNQGTVTSFSAPGTFSIMLPNLSTAFDQFILYLPTVFVDGQEFSVETTLGGNAFCWFR